MKKIKTAFIFDGWDPSNDISKVDFEKGGVLEFWTSISALTHCLGLNPDEEDIIDVAIVAGYASEELLSNRYDLLVIDYGGMSIWGATGTATEQVRAVCRYADEHPSTLVVIWTDFTADIYRYDLEEDFGTLDNITFRYQERQTFDRKVGDLDGSFEFQDFVKQWFAAEVASVVSNRSG